MHRCCATTTTCSPSTSTPVASTCSPTTARWTPRRRRRLGGSALRPGLDLPLGGRPSLSGLEIRSPAAGTRSSGCAAASSPTGAATSRPATRRPRRRGTREVASHDGVTAGRGRARRRPGRGGHGRPEGRPAGSGAADVTSTEADLVAAASDDRLILPGAAPVAPPRIDVDTFAAEGVAALVKPGEAFEQTGISRTPWVRGSLDRRRRRARHAGLDGGAGLQRGAGSPA